MSTSHTRIWAGIDAGKGHHWAVAIDTGGETLFSTKVVNDEARIRNLIETARERADGVRWAVDISGRASTLLLALDERIKDNDREIRETFRTDGRAEIIESMPGMGPILGAEFVAIVGDLSGYRDAGRPASHAGLAPVARDSGRRTGDHHRPKRYNRRLRHIFYLAAQTAMMRPGPSRDHYLRKRAEVLLHTQALLAPARRRVDVLWAMLRDKRLFTSVPPVTQAA